MTESTLISDAMLFQGSVASLVFVGLPICLFGTAHLVLACHSLGLSSHRVRTRTSWQNPTFDAYYNATTPLHHLHVVLLQVVLLIGHTTSHLDAPRRSVYFFLVCYLAWGRRSIQPFKARNFFLLLISSGSGYLLRTWVPSAMFCGGDHTCSQRNTLRTGLACCLVAQRVCEMFFEPLGRQHLLPGSGSPLSHSRHPVCASFVQPATISCRPTSFAHTGCTLCSNWLS